MGRTRPRAQDQSLVGEVRSHRLHDERKREKEETRGKRERKEGRKDTILGEQLTKEQGEGKYPKKVALKLTSKGVGSAIHVKDVCWKGYEKKRKNSPNRKNSMFKAQRQQTKRRVQSQRDGAQAPKGRMKHGAYDEDRS